MYPLLVIKMFLSLLCCADLQPYGLGSQRVSYLARYIVLRRLPAGHTVSRIMIVVEQLIEDILNVTLQVAPLNREAWWRLGRCRLELEDFRNAHGPLTHALKGWPTHPANGAAWRSLVQAALGAGQKEKASTALQGWLHSLGGGADAALALGDGGRVNVNDLEQELSVGFVPP